MTQPLNPCPFCGGEDVVYDLYPGDAGGFHVQCRECMAESWDEESDVVVRKWNTRTPQECPVIEEMEWELVDEDMLRSGPYIIYDDDGYLALESDTYHRMFLNEPGAEEKAKQAALDHANGLLRQLYEMAVNK